MVDGGSSQTWVRQSHSSFFRLARTTVVALALVVAVFSVGLSWSSSKDPRRTINDFTADYISARAWLDGRNAYSPIDGLAGRYVADPLGVTSFYGGTRHRNPHPPTYILLTAPFASLPYVAARNAWLILMASSVALAMAIVARTSGARWFLALAVALGSLGLPPVLSELKLGGADALVLLAITVAWWQLQKNRPLRAGTALGLASAVKLYPLFLVIPLIRRGGLKPAVVQLGTAAAVTGASAYAIGGAPTRQLLTQAMPANTRYWLADPHNLSLLAIPIRWLTATHWKTGFVDVPALAYGVAALLALFCVVAGATTPSRLSQDVYWSAVPWMLLIAPLFWYQYLLLALPGIYLLFQNQLRLKLLPPWFVLIATGFLLVWTLGFVASDARDVAIWLGVFALPTYGLVILGISEWSRPHPASTKAASGVA